MHKAMFRQVTANELAKSFMTWQIYIYIFVTQKAKSQYANEKGNISSLRGKFQNKVN